MIVVVSVAFLVTSCATIGVNEKWAEVRFSANLAEDGLKEALEIDSVESQNVSVPEEVLHNTFRRSLAANNYLATYGKSTKYSISVSLLGSSVTTGYINEAVVNIKYLISNAQTNEIEFENTIQSKAVISTKPDVFGALIYGLQAATNSYSADPQNVNRLEAVSAYSERDFELGYPEEGTPINSSNGADRASYALDAALRQNYVKFMQAIDAKVQEVNKQRRSDATERGVM